MNTRIENVSVQASMETSEFLQWIVFVYVVYVSVSEWAERGCDGRTVGVKKRRTEAFSLPEPIERLRRS